MGKLNHKINLQISVVFLYNDNEIYKMKFKHFPIYNSIKNNKILRNKFNQGEERSVQ